jgi:hypothetical protein
MAFGVIAAGAMVVGGLVQAYNSEKARGASKERLREIEALYESITPPDYDLSITDPPRMHQETLQMPQFGSMEAAPKWDMKKLEPRELKLMEKFTPQIAPMVYEENPTLIKKSEDMKMGAAAEKKALRRFMDVGEGDFDPIYQQRVKEARDRAQAEAQSRSDSITQDFARRGIGGSGMELAAKMGGASQAMDRNAQMGMQAEAQAYQNQMQALAQGAQLGGQIQDRDISLQGRNASIINDFNQRMSKRHQQWNQMRADQLNAADLRNIQEAQRISDQNTMTQNQYDQRHQSRMDDIALKNYQAKVDEMNRQDALSKWRYNAEGQERAYRDQANIMSAKWRQDEKRYGNDMQTQIYNNQLAKAAGKAGISGQMSQMDMQGARDRNSAIQGLANMGMMYAMNQDANQQRQLDRDAYGTRKTASGGGWGDNYNPYKGYA